MNEYGFFRGLRISASADLTICGNELKLVIKLAC